MISSRPLIGQPPPPCWKILWWWQQKQKKVSVVLSTSVNRFFVSRMTRFRVFGGGWVQSSTFFYFFSFHDYFVFIGLYASLYIVDKEKYKKILKNLYFWGFIPFDCLISPKIFCFNAFNIRLSFIKKPKKKTFKNSFFGNLKIWGWAYSKIFGCHVFFLQNFCFRGCVWFFLTKA